MYVQFWMDAHRCRITAIKAMAAVANKASGSVLPRPASFLVVVVVAAVSHPHVPPPLSQQPDDPPPQSLHPWAIAPTPTPTPLPLEHVAGYLATGNVTGLEDLVFITEPLPIWRGCTMPTTWPSTWNLWQRCTRTSWQVPGRESS